MTAGDTGQIQTRLARQGDGSLRDTLAVLFRAKLAALIFFLVVVSTVTLGTFVLPELYESEVRLLILAGRENLATDPTVVGPTVMMVQQRDNDVSSEVGILQSRILASQVIDRIGVETFLARPDEAPSDRDGQRELRDLRRAVREQADWFEKLMVDLDLRSALTRRERAIQELLENTRIEVEKDSSLITVRLLARSPQLAQASLDFLVEFYLQRHLEVHGTQAKPAFFEEQSSRLLKRLNLNEDQLERFRESWRISSLEDEKSALLSLIGELEREFDEVQGQIASSDAKVRALAATLARRAPSIVLHRTTGKTNFAADAIKERLTELELEQARLSASYPSEHRLMQDIDEQVRLAREALAGEGRTHTEVTTGVDVSYQNMRLELETERAELEAHQARRSSLRGGLERRRAELAALVNNEVQLGRLTRDVQIADKEYREYRDNVQRALIDAAMDRSKVSNVSVVQPATMSLEAVRPRKLLNILAGIFLGLFGGAALAFLLDFLDDSLKSPEDVRKRLGIPVLGTLSEQEYRRCT